MRDSEVTKVGAQARAANVKWPCDRLVDVSLRGKAAIVHDDWQAPPQRLTTRQSARRRAIWRGFKMMTTSPVFLRRPVGTCVGQSWTWSWCGGEGGRYACVVVHRPYRQVGRERQDRW
jgi:hypothetical protein